MKSEDKKMHLSDDDAMATESFDNSNGDSAIKNNRFQPGKSGNLKGRPKGSKNHKTIIREIAAEKHRINTNKGNQSLTTIELALLELRYHVASGNTVAPLQRCQRNMKPANRSRPTKHDGTDIPHLYLTHVVLNAIHCCSAYTIFTSQFYQTNAWASPTFVASAGNLF